MRAEAEAALNRDRVTEIHGGDDEAADGARWRLQEAPEPPTMFGYLRDWRLASRGGYYWSDVIKDTCLHLQLCTGSTVDRPAAGAHGAAGFSGTGVGWHR